MSKQDDCIVKVAKSEYVALPPLMNACQAKMASSMVTSEQKVRQELLRLNECVNDAISYGDYRCYYTLRDERIKEEFLTAVRELGYTVDFRTEYSITLLISWN